MNRQDVTAAEASPPSPRVAVAAPALVAALVATLITQFVPLLGPLLIALLIGAAVANTRWAAAPMLRGHAQVTKLLLRWGVVLIGLKLPLGDILAIGIPGVVVVTATVGLTFLGTRAVGRRMNLDRNFVTLLAAGFSICGAAAIAAVSDAVRAREKDVALSIAMVTLFGSAMLLVLPPVSQLLGLSDTEAAIWAGASIHEVAQVVAAASLVSGSAIAVATTVKLGRVALLAPVYVIVARGEGQPHDRVPLVPWFLIGFLVMVALRSSGLLPDDVLDVSGYATTVLLAAGMFGLGLGFRFADLWPFPPQAFILSVISTLIAAGSSLALISLLYR